MTKLDMIKNASRSIQTTMRVTERPSVDTAPLFALMPYRSTCPSLSISEMPDTYGDQCLLSRSKENATSQSTPTHKHIWCILPVGTVYTRDMASTELLALRSRSFQH